MRSFQQIVVLLFALVAFAFAQESDVYDSTVYVTSTVHRVSTITRSGIHTGIPANMTSTISASHAPTDPASVGLGPYGTSVVLPSGSGPKSTSPPFTGAASALSINAYVAALVAGVGYFAL